MRMDSNTIFFDRNFIQKPQGIHLCYHVSNVARNKHRLNVKFGDLENNVSTIGRELAEIGTFLFCIENFHQDGYSEFKNASFRSRIPKFWSNLKRDFELIFELLTKNRIDLEFVPFPKSYVEKKVECNHLKKYDACSLFSDGIDSYVTFSQFQSHGYAIFGANTTHNPTMSGRIKTIEGMLDKPKIYIHSLNKNLPKRAIGHLQQTRAFMYLCNAAAYSEIHQTNKIIVGECGPVMHQPKFLPSDVVTTTTNVAMLKAAESLFSKTFSTKFKLLTPFENNTKAEMMSLLPKNVKSSKMDHFSSCLKMSRRGKMCGKCYSCLLRKLSGVVSNVVDLDFENDILTDGLKSTGDLQDLVPFLQFCKTVLIDFSGLDFESRYIIEQYNKEELFIRNSMDVLSGLYLLYIKKTINTKNKLASNFINECLKDKIVTKEQLDDRIEKIRVHDFPSPNLII